MDERTTGRPGARSTLALGLASAAANVLAYVFTIAMSRLLGVRDFGELGTQLAVWLIAQIPTIACQLTAAKAVAGAVSGPAVAAGEGGVHPAAGPRGPATEAAMLRLGVRLGVLEAGALVLAAVPLAAALHVGVPAMLWLAAGQLPLTVVFALLGIFQGRSAFGRFGLLMAGFQALRLAGGVAVAAAGLGPAAVWASTALAGLIAGVAGWRSAGVPVVSAFGRVPGVAADRWAVLARGTASMGGLLLLTTADLLMAGHFLAGDARGVYASGNVLTRIAFWGPQFIGTLAYPGLVRPGDRARARRLALLAVGGLALAGLLLALLAGRQLVGLVFGPAYGSLAPLAPLFVLVGAAAAVLNVVLLDDVATGRTLGTRLAFTAVVVEAAAVTLWWHSSPGQVVATAAAVCSATALLAVAVTAGGPQGRRSARHARARLLGQRMVGRHRTATVEPSAVAAEP